MSSNWPSSCSADLEVPSDAPKRGFRQGRSRRLLGVVGLCMLLISGLQLSAQENSPFSRFGIGDILEDDFIAGRGMGGISTGLFDRNTLNIANPASYAYLQRTTFDFGIYGNVLRLDDGSEINSSGNGSLTHLAFGFPVIRNKMGLSVGLVPFSRTQYNIQDFEVSADTLLGRLDYEFRGEGALYDIYIGAGYRWNGFSVGVNASYLFGTIDRSRFLSFPDVDGSYSTRAITANSVGGLVFDLGAGYRVDFPNDLDLNIGVTGRLQTNVGGRENVEWTTVQLIDNGALFFKDSVTVTELRDNGITLPAEFSAGFTLRQGYRSIDDPLWRIGVDFSMGQWSNFEGFDSEQPFVNSWKIQAGFEVTPVDNAETNGRPVDLRAGFQYGKSNLSFDGQDLSEFGITIGLGVPISLGTAQQRNSKLNFAFTAGQRGNSSVFTETFYRGTIGFTFSDSFWFLKSKVN